MKEEIDNFDLINTNKYSKKAKALIKISKENKIEKNNIYLKNNKIKIYRINDYSYLKKNQLRIYINILIIIIFNYFIVCSTINLKIIKPIFFSEITMTIKGKGNQKILSIYTGYLGIGLSIYSNFDTLPSEIYINGKYQNYTGKYIYNLEKEINFITLRWNCSITNCNAMFKDLKNILEIDFSKFDSSGVTSMVAMFHNCSSLISLNLTWFNTSKVTIMHMMFKECISLISLDLNYFDTSLVTNMEYMFHSCKKLIALNLASFNTLNVINMNSMFYSCTSLISLDLSIFDVSKVTNMYGMFYGCKNLKFLDLSKFGQNSCGSFINFLVDCNSILCINNYENLDSSLKYQISSNKNNCSDMCFINKSKKLILDKNICIDNCFNEDNNMFELNKICYSSCPNGTRISLHNNYSCEINLTKERYDISDIYDNSSDEKNNSEEKTFLLSIIMCPNKCNECSLESLKNDLCISCNTNFSYYEIINDSRNNDSFINCYKNPIGYYLDNNEKKYKPCYFKCKSCTEVGDENNNKCTSCINNYEFKNDFTNDSNCYEISQYYYYFDSERKHHCTLNYTCPKEYNKLIIEKNRCIDYCTNDNIYKYEKNNICYSFQKMECPEEFPYININNNSCVKDCKEEDVINNICLLNNPKDKNEDDIILKIKNQVLNGTLDSLLLNITEVEKQDLLLLQNDILYQITTSEKQKNNTYSNISTILLGDCENILKDHYNISENLSLIILKVDSFQEGSLIPVIDYEVYHPTKKEKLDLKYCNNSYINLSIPVSIDENNLFKYDPNNDYYNDQCNSYSNEHGTDILLNDRQNEYNNNNMSICEKDCNIKEYSSSTKKVTCECEIKYNQLNISEMANGTDLLKYNFTNKNLSSNMISMKCYYTLFTKEGIYKNIGNYILLFFILTFIISGILFYKCGYPLLEDIINGIIDIKNENEKDFNKNETIDINYDSCNKVIKKKKKKKKKKKNLVHKNIKQKNKSKSLSKIELNMKNEKFSNKNYVENLNVLNTPKNYNDYELNSFSYKNALKYDKRNFSSIYISLIRTKHPFMFSFCPIKDFNSIIIKIDLFMVSFSLFYFFNALFFDESTIHKIYEDQGIYNIVFLIPFIAYSFIISHTLSIIIKYFSLSERNIGELKNLDYNGKINNVDKVKKCLIIKYLCFFGCGLLFLLFLWYYLSSFGAVYQNTQIYLIKNTLISFGFSLIYPFIINLLVTIFRKYSLNNSKRECVYNFVKIIQYI